MIDYIGHNCFRSVPAPENSILTMQDLKVRDRYLLRFSPGHSKNVAILSDGTAVLPYIHWEQNPPLAGDIWPVEICLITNVIYVMPIDRRVFNLRVKRLAVNHAWPTRKLIRIVSENNELKADIDGKTLSVDFSNWIEPPAEGQVWAVSINQIEAEMPLTVRPIIKVEKRWENRKLSDNKIHQ